MTRVTLREAYRDIRAYDVDAARYALELADNTSPYGPPPAVRAFLATAGDVNVSRYPTTYSRPLREALARYIGVSPDEIMVGAGSDEILSGTFRALGNPGATVAHMHPTFVMARVFAQTNSLNPVAIGLTPTWDADADALLATRADIIYLCTPNNPTGTPVQRATLDHIVETSAGLVMVDEAYAEFAGTNLAAEAPGRDGMLVLRTLSKAFGLAGIRLGFAVGERALIAELEKARGPYAVSALSEQAALVAVEHDTAWIMERVAEANATRDQFLRELQSVGYAPLPSLANFVLLPIPGAARVAAAMRSRDVLVRHFEGLPGIGDALRISMGRPPDMSRVLQILQECAT